MRHTGRVRPEPVTVPEDPIRLGQLLKLVGVAESGAHARELLVEGEVRVNGEAETRRGRRLTAGDVIAVGLPSGERSFVIG